MIYCDTPSTHSHWSISRRSVWGPS